MSVEVLTQEDFSGGAFRDAAPQLIDPRAVFDLINCLTDEEGSLYRRGGSANKSNAAFGTSLRLLWDGHLKPGQRTVFANSTPDFGVLAADDATPLNLGGTPLSLPASPAELRGLLFLPGGSIYGGSRKTASYSTGTVTLTLGSKTITGAGTTWLANVDAGMLFRRGSERVYVVESVDSNTQITLEDAYEGAGGSGIAYSLSPLLAATAPYEAANFYGVCADRLIVATENRVRFGALDNPHAAFGANDYHELPEGGRIVGFGTVGTTLVVFATSGIWTIDGLGVSIVDQAGNAQHRVQQFSQDLVCLGSAGIATWQSRLVVPCQDSIWLVDGVSTPVEIGHPIEALYREYVSLGHRPGGAAVFNSHYFLPIVDASGAWVDLLVCRLDRPIDVRGKLTFPWARFSGAGGSLSALARRSTEVGAPALLGATNASTARVVDCAAFFRPDAAHKADADGSTYEWGVVSRDFPVEMGVLRKVKARYEGIDAASDDPTLRLDVASGVRLAESALKWNTPGLKWNAAGLRWPGTGDRNTDWTSIQGTAPESDGTKPFTWHLHWRLRHARLRITSVSPWARLALRSLELHFRPSRKVR